MRFIGLVCLGLLTTAALNASVDWSTYKPSGYVNDFTGLFEDSTLNRLDTFVRQVNKRYEVKVAAVVLPSLEGEHAANVAEFFYDYWNLGRDHSAAALVLLSPADNKTFLYIGEGLLTVLDERWESAYNLEVLAKLGSGQPKASMVVALKSIAAQIHTHSDEVAAGVLAAESSAAISAGDGHAFGSKRRGFGSAKTDEGVKEVGGLPVVALVAGGFGGFLLLSTMLKAGQHHKSFYDYGNGFERGRTGPFGNKKPRWQDNRKR